jgi:protein-disulfide isomerase
MNSETKIISIIGVITLIIIIAGMVLASGASNNTSKPVALSEDRLVRPESPRVKGVNAKVQMVEFADFECPACQMMQPELKKLLAEYGDSIDFVFRIIPIHSKSKELGAVALSANEQGKFKEMHDKLFEGTNEWNKVGLKETERFAIYDRYATEIGLDVEKFKSDLKNNRSKYDAIVDQDAADAGAMNIQSTPTLVVNGKTVVRGVQRYEALKTIVEEALAQENATSTDMSTTTELDLGMDL